MPTLRFWFSAPFRTRVTFDSSVLEWCPEAARDSLAQAAQAITAQLATPCDATSGIPHADPEHRYATLSEDADQQFVTPVLVVHAPHALREVLEQAIRAAGTTLDAANPRIDPATARIALFDNTVAVLEWGLALDCPDGGEATLLGAIDRASFLASSAGVQWIQRKLMPVAVRAIDAGFRRHEPLPSALHLLPVPTRRLRLLRRVSRALRRPREATAFFDMPAATGGNGLMWVSRVLACAGSPGSAAVDWSGWRGQSPGDDHGEAHLLAATGNSLLMECEDGNKGMDDVVSAYRKVQYLYALLDVHGRNITRLSSGFLARRRDFLADTMLRLDRIQSHLSVVESRKIDVFAGLQGARARHCEALSQAWDLSGKQEGVHRKAAIAKEMVERFARNQSMKYQKIVQFILAVVGVLALADVVINITAFSQTVGDDAAWGIVKAVRSVAADTLLTSTGIVLVASIVILGLLFRRG